MKPQVKKLRWKAVTDQSDVEAKSIVGKYRIIARGFRPTIYSLEFEHTFNSPDFPTMEEAKAAAQTDFARRVLSALVKNPSPQSREAGE